MKSDEHGDTVIYLRIPKRVVAEMDALIKEEKLLLDPMESINGITRSSMARRFIVIGLRSAGRLRTPQQKKSAEVLKKIERNLSKKAG